MSTHALNFGTKHRAKLLLVALLTLLLPVFAFAQRGPCGGGGGQCGGGPGAMGPGMGPPPVELLAERAAEAGVDEATIAQLKEIAEQERAAAEGLLEELENARQALHELMQAASPDEAAVMQQAEAVGAITTDLRKLRLRSHLATRALLTQEQWEAMRPGRGGRGKGGRGHGPHGPGGW